MRGYDLTGFRLSKAIRFYETGVKSSLGEELAEFGFPTDTIRKIEKAYPIFLSFNLNQSREFYERNKSGITGLLDNYEKTLIEKAIKSIVLA